MISDFLQFDKKGLRVSVNWNDNVKSCKKIKFEINGERAIVSHEDLYTLLSIFADETEAERLIRVKKEVVQPITKEIHVLAQKNIKKGERVSFQYTYYVPKDIVELVKKDTLKKK